MTDYERLAADMTDAGLSGSIRSARDLADRSFYGGPMSIMESVVVAVWIARPWKPGGRQPDREEKIPTTLTFTH